MKISKVVAGSLLLALVSVAAPAYAGPPGPGDKQCIPGQNGMPQPGGKTGTCPPK